jgi:hypothetical protein
MNDFVTEINVSAGQASGLGVDSIMSYLKTNGTFTHSNGDVREASKHATVAIYRHVGTFRIYENFWYLGCSCNYCCCVLGAVPLATYLTLLRKNQRGEYEEAFKQAVGNSPVGVPKKPHSTTPSKNSKTGDHVDESDNASQASRSSQASSAARGGGAKSSSPATAEPKQGGSHAHAHHHPHNHVAQGSGVIQTHGNHPPRANELPAINEADEHRKFMFSRAQC